MGRGSSWSCGPTPSTTGFGRLMTGCRSHCPDDILADFESFPDKSTDALKLILGVVPGGEAVASDEKADESRESGDDE